MQEARTAMLRLFATAPQAEPHRASSGVVSLLVHLVVLTCLVAAGVAPHRSAPQERIERVTLIQLEDKAPEPPPAAARPLPPPPPRGFQTLSAPVNIPSQVPAPDSAATVEANFSGQGVEGGFASNLPPTAVPEQSMTYELADVSVAPRMIKVEKPEYPPELVSMGIGGTVLVGIDILPSGDPDESSVRVIRPLNPILDGSAIRALLRTRFSPACIGSRPVRVAVIVPYTFGTR